MVCYGNRFGVTNYKSSNDTTSVSDILPQLTNPSQIILDWFLCKEGSNGKTSPSIIKYPGITLSNPKFFLSSLLDCMNFLEAINNVEPGSDYHSDLGRFAFSTDCAKDGPETSSL